MRGNRSIEAGLVLALLAAAPALAQSPAPPLAPPMAQDRAAAAEAADVGAARSVIAEFLEAGYLQAWFAYPDNVRRHFADPVEGYWGRRNVPLAQVVQDKLAYARKWTFRFYKLKPETLVVRPVAGRRDTFEAIFEYEFLADAVPPRSEGVGVTTLILELAGERILIHSEQGRVLERRRGVS